MDRRLEVDLAADARFLGVETLVFGRTAMGERVGQGWLRDLIRVRRGGELLLHDAIRIDGEIDATLQRTAVGAGAKVVATIVYVAPDTAEKLADLRSTALSPPRSASRVLGARTYRSRGHRPERHADRAHPRTRQCLGATTVIAALAVLREDRPLPRVWLC